MMTDTSSAAATSILEVIGHLETEPDRLKSNWCVPPEEGRFLYLITVISKASRVLEVGTSIGYSGLWFSLGLLETSGVLETIDASEERLNEAKKHFKQAGLNEAQFVGHLGQALPTLESLQQAGKQFDVMFIDARKEEYIDYLRHAESLLKPQGLLIADNTESHKASMQDFLETISQSNHWEISNLATPNGILLARKKG